MSIDDLAASVLASLSDRELERWRDAEFQLWVADPDRSRHTAAEAEYVGRLLAEMDALTWDDDLALAIDRLPEVEEPRP